MSEHRDQAEDQDGVRTGSYRCTCMGVLGECERCGGCGYRTITIHASDPVSIVVTFPDDSFISEDVPAGRVRTTITRWLAETNAIRATWFVGDHGRAVYPEWVGR